jgi:hypothetical protein
MSISISGLLDAFTTNFVGVINNPDGKWDPVFQNRAGVYTNARGDRVGPASISVFTEEQARHVTEALTVKFPVTLYRHVANTLCHEFGIGSIGDLKVELAAMFENQMQCAVMLMEKAAELGGAAAAAAPAPAAAPRAPAAAPSRAAPGMGGAGGPTARPAGRVSPARTEDPENWEGGSVGGSHVTSGAADVHELADGDVLVATRITQRTTQTCHLFFNVDGRWQQQCQGKPEFDLDQLKVKRSRAEVCGNCTRSEKNKTLGLAWTGKAPLRLSGEEDEEAALEGVCGMLKHLLVGDRCKALCTPTHFTDKVQAAVVDALLASEVFKEMSRAYSSVSGSHASGPHGGGAASPFPPAMTSPHFRR